MLPLRNPIRPYPWGSREAIAGLLGEPVPSPEPQAELWMGAHPEDPSVLPDGTPLPARIAADPVGELGARTVREFGPELPFLAKLLAAARPLSLQVHPDAEQARAGYAAEDAAGVDRGDPRRNYRDPNHKPELICALTPFRGLVGFRPVEETRALLAALAVPGLAPFDGMLAAGDLRGAVAAALTLDPRERAPLVAAIGTACAGPGGFADERVAVAELAAAYPDDPGVVVALLLNLVRLAPGEAMFLPAGMLHAYLDGLGIEVLANSDNVLRGGLTGKHVDVPELLAILDPTPGLPRLRTGRAAGVGEWVYDVPAREFLLTRVGSGARLGADGARILVCTAGAVGLTQAGEHRELAPGRSVYLPAGGGPVALSGEGEAFCVGTNLDAPGVH